MDGTADDPALLRVARAIARSRGPDAQLCPDDERAARAAIAAMTELGLVLTVARRHEVHAELLSALAKRPPRLLDLWDAQQITVFQWLLALALDEEQAARRAAGRGDARVRVSPPTRPRAAA